MIPEVKYIALCPACSARLPMNDSHMEIANGNIRCGKCNTAFYAPEHLLRGFYSPKQQKESQSLLTDSDFLPFNLASQEEELSEETYEELREKLSQEKHTNLAKEKEEEPSEELSEEPYEEPREKFSQEKHTNLAKEKEEEPSEELSEEPYEEPREKLSQERHVDADLITNQEKKEPREKPILESRNAKKVARKKKEDPLNFLAEDEQVISQPEKRKPKKRLPRKHLSHETGKSNSKKWLWIPAIFFLVVILGLQALIINVSSWSQHPLLRGAYSQICSIGLCDLPVDLKPVSLSIEIAGYKRLSDGGYEVKGLLTNWAYYSQKMPVIRLSFVDLAENEKFAKNFTPEDYLADEQKDKVTLESEEAFHFSITVSELEKEKRHFFPRLDLVSY